MLFDRQGHRGCRGLMPENTIPAMIYAIDLDVTTLEMDVHITKDSQVVLSHDPWSNSEITTKPGGTFINGAEPKFILYQMNYADIKQFDVGNKFYNKFPRQLKLHTYKPLLKELIDSVEIYTFGKKRSPFYNIEIKSTVAGEGLYHPGYREFTDLLVKVIYEKQVRERVIIQSFDRRALKYMHVQYPEIKTSFLINESDKRSPGEQIHNLGFKPTIYSPQYSLVTPEVVKWCTRRNIKVIPWTVNDAGIMKKLKDMGVHGLISDYPDLFKKL